MDISVLISTYNRSASLERTLNSLLTLSERPGRTWEIVVVDNASRDDTADVIRAFALRSPVPVRSLYEARPGQSAAQNSGLAVCQGGIIAFTDDDAIPSPDWLDQLEDAFDRLDADWVFGPVLPDWEDVAPPWFSALLNGRFAFLDYGLKPFIATARHHSFAGVNSACRRSAMLPLGGFREDFSRRGDDGGGGDTELFERALAAGQRIAYVPEVRVRHTVAAVRATKTFQRVRVWRSGCNSFRHLRENYPSVPYLMDLPRFFFSKAIEDLASYLKSVVRRDRPLAFYSELQLIRFGALLYRSLGERARRVAIFTGLRPAEQR